MIEVKEYSSKNILIIPESICLNEGLLKRTEQDVELFKENIILERMEPYWC